MTDTTIPAQIFIHGEPCPRRGEGRNNGPWMRINEYVHSAGIVFYRVWDGLEKCVSWHCVYEQGSNSGRKPTSDMVCYSPEEAFATLLRHCVDDFNRAKVQLAQATEEMEGKRADVATLNAIIDLPRLRAIQ